jgi:hypothetical protein
MPRQHGIIGTSSRIVTIREPKVRIVQKRCEHCGQFKRIKDSEKKGGGTNLAPLYFCSSQCAFAHMNDKNYQKAFRIKQLNELKKQKYEKSLDNIFTSFDGSDLPEKF